MAFARTSLVTAALLAALAGGAMAQTPPAAPAGPAAAPHMQMHGHGRADGHGHGRMDPAQRQEWANKRLAELKQKLQITPAQEGAWTAFAAAHQPPANATRPDREAMARMTTPERIDQMRAMRTQRNAEMDRRMEATKAFYGALTPDQRKLFDAQTTRHAQRGGHHGGMHRG